MNINLYHNNLIEISDLNGATGCEDGPSIIENFCVCWCKNNRLHREDGPAIVYTVGRWKEHYPDGRFYLNSIEYNKKDYLKKLETMKDENQPIP